MNRLTVGVILALLAFGCAPPTLRELPPSEQRALGEAAVAEVCAYALDVETPIAFRHRYNLHVARQYLDEIVPAELSEGQLSQFFTLETIGACAADLEWGGVNYDVQRLVERHGTDVERAHCRLSVSACTAQAGRLSSRRAGRSGILSNSPRVRDAR